MEKMVESARTYATVTRNLKKSDQESHRRRRAVFNFMQPILTGLFGIASDDQLQNLKSNIDILRDRNELLSGAVSKSLVILNDTRVDVARNRHNLNLLTESVRLTRRMLRSSITEIKQDISAEFNFNHFLNRLHSLFHMSSNSLHRIAFNLQMLQSDLEMAWQGRLSPTLIPSAQLNKLLHQVRKQMDKTYSLPFPLRNMSEYYKSLPVVAACDNDVIHMAMIIPLKKTGQYYDLMEVIPIPKSIHNSLHYWDIESKFLAISNDKSHFAYLSKEQYDNCRNGYCINDAPIYKMQDTPSSVIALYNDDKKSVTQTCGYSKEPLPSSTIAKHIYGTKWVILSHQPWTINVICNANDASAGKTNKFTNINDDVYILNIPANCEANGRYFHIPKSDNRQLTTNLVANDISIIKYTDWNLTAPVPDVPYSAFSYGTDDADNVAIPNTLPPLQSNVDIDDIFNQIKTQNTVWHDMHSHKFNWWPIFILVGCALCVVAIIVLGLKWNLLRKRILFLQKRDKPVPDRIVLDKRRAADDDTRDESEEIMITHDTDHRHACGCE